MGGGWAGGGGKEGSREEFKRGNLRQPELINAEGEGGGGKAPVQPVWPRGPGTMFLCVVEWVGSQQVWRRSLPAPGLSQGVRKMRFGFLGYGLLKF